MNLCMFLHVAERLPATLPGTGRHDAVPGNEIAPGRLTTLRVVKPRAVWPLPRTLSRGTNVYLLAKSGPVKCLEFKELPISKLCFERGGQNGVYGHLYNIVNSFYFLINCFVLPAPQVLGEGPYAKWYKRDKEWPLGCCLPYSIVLLLLFPIFIKVTTFLSELRWVFDV